MGNIRGSERGIKEGGIVGGKRERERERENDKGRLGKRKHRK